MVKPLARPAMRPLLGLLLAANLSLPGCTLQDADFPSLARRDVELADRTPEPAEPDPVVAADPALASQLSALADRARSSQARFAEALPQTRRLVEAAKGAAPGTENWSVAQASLAALEVSRKDTALALADADALYVQRAVIEAEETAPVGTAAAVDATRKMIAGLLDGQQREMDRMTASLAR